MLFLKHNLNLIIKKPNKLINSSLFRLFNNDVQLFQVTKSIQDIKRRVLKNLDGDLKQQIKRDILIYEHKRPYLKYLFIYNVVQYLFWCYGATWAYLFYFNKPKKEKRVLTNREDLLKSLDPVSQSLWEPFIRRKEKYLIALVFLLLGHVSTILLSFFSLRSIKTITLLKGAQTVRITTYSIFGTTNNRFYFDLPIDNVSSQVHRNAASSYIPVKIKGKRFFYLIDIKGLFYHPTLFDHTVGVFRVLK